MLTPYLPYPPASGGQIRTYNLLKHLSRSHEVHLVCLYKKPEEKDQAKHLEQFCKKIYLCKRPEKPWQVSTVFKSVFGKLPFLIVRNYSEEAAQTVRSLISKYDFDVIHAETFYIMPHIPETSIPILLVEQTIEYRVYKHFIQSKPWFIHHPLRLDTFKLRYWERYFWRKATLVAAVSEADARAIKMLAPEMEPVVIPNGAGDEMFEHQALFARTDMNDRVKILFLGNFSWLQNKEAADILVKNIYPHLVKLIPHLEIVIAGQNIPKYYASLISDQISIVDLEHANTQAVKDLYAASHMFVAPIYGPGGTRLKILAAMATRIPIITTATGAEGLSLEDNVSYLQAQSTDDFVRQIVRLSHDVELQKNITEHAYQLARKKYSWEAITRDLIAAYHQIIKIPKIEVISK